MFNQQRGLRQSSEANSIYHFEERAPAALGHRWLELDAQRQIESPCRTQVHKRENVESLSVQRIQMNTEWVSGNQNTLYSSD